MKTAAPAGVRWVSWEPGNGFGNAAMGYVGALDAVGVPVTWTPIEQVAGQLQVTADYRGPLRHLAGRDIHYDAVVLHQVPNLDRWLRQAEGRRRVILATWETDRVPRWATAFERADAVFVPSAFNRDAVLASGCASPVHVVPHCARQVPCVEPARYERVGDRFVFYTIASWCTRKAMGETISAFLDAFSARDDVALVVKTTSFDQEAVARSRQGLPVRGPSRWQGASWVTFASLLAGRRNVPELVLIADDVPAHEIDALHARGDCFLSLTRSEGWGLSIADAVLFGNPVVVTGWGGHLDYLGPDYPLLVDYEIVPTSSDPADGWFEPSGLHRWARADHDHAVDVMRWVVDNREAAAAVTGPVGDRLARECAPESIGRRLQDLLARL